MTRVLLESADLAVTVRAYAPGERHPRHTDRHSRISLLLRGGYREEGRAGALRLTPGDVLLKSRRAAHEDEFGAEGATVAALEFHRDDPFDQSGQGELWRRRGDAFALRHALAMLEAALAGMSDAVACAGADLLAAGTGARLSAAPPWLSQLKHELESASLAHVNVATRAREAGAHPAHVSRLFRKCFGASITEHAQVHSVRRALAPLEQKDMPLSEVAIAAGFYDQSHMTRVFRRVTGRTPGAHRALLAAC